MKIIDSNTDYYDFYQNIYRDNTVTFDRKDSYNLTKQEFAHYFEYVPNCKRVYQDWNRHKVKHILLQICYDFWLMRLTVTETDNYGQCQDYDLDLIDHWKDDTKPAKSIELSWLKMPWYIGKENNDIVDAIKHNDYIQYEVFNRFHNNHIIKGKFIEDVRTIPILQNIGIPSIIPPLDIYLALEEYVIQEKADGERRESIGLTNNEKIENHGFDLKTSFRGK